VITTNQIFIDKITVNEKCEVVVKIPGNKPDQLKKKTNKNK
jgi:hypothetical protein